MEATEFVLVEVHFCGRKGLLCPFSGSSGLASQNVLTAFKTDVTKQVTIFKSRLLFLSLKHSTLNNNQRTVLLGYLFARYILYYQWTLIDMQAIICEWVEKKEKYSMVNWSDQWKVTLYDTIWYVLFMPCLLLQCQLIAVFVNIFWKNNHWLSVCIKEAIF